MAQTPSFYVNSPVSGTQYFATMGYGAIPNNATSVTCTVKAWTGANGTGSLVAVTSITATVHNQTTSVDSSFTASSANTANASHTAANSTDWYKASAKYTGGAIGSLEMFLVYTGSAFVPTTPTFSPSSGAQGSSVTVSGSHFTDATSVLFNGTSASFSITNDTTISATVPVGATAGPITVGNPSGSAASATNFTPANVRVFRTGVWVVGPAHVERTGAPVVGVVYVFRSGVWVVGS